MQLIEYFINFLEKNKKEKIVNLLKLKDDFDTMSPVPPLDLPVSDPDESIKRIPCVVIKNFVKMFGVRSFNMKGLTVLGNILRRDDVNSRAQQQLLLHITKYDISSSTASYIFTQIEKLVLVTSLSDETDIWKRLALSTMQHPQIIKLVDDLIDMHFDGIKIKSPGAVSVNFVSIPFYKLRGYSGLNGIYINETHFNKNHLEHKSDHRAEYITKIDIVTITIHEYAHVRLRQKLDEFNISTRFILKEPEKVYKSHRGFGRMIEFELFKGQVDWWQSILVDINYISNFLAAIEAGTDLPRLDAENEPSYRTSSTAIFGIDMVEDDLFMC